jgi:hypothetical protein
LGGSLMASATVVLGAAVGYTAAQIEPFLRSLRNAGYFGDVALIIDPARAPGLAQLPLFAGVQLLPARQWIPVRWELVKAPWKMALVWGPIQRSLWWLLRLLRGLPLPPAMIEALVHAVHYLRFLAAHAYERVLISDVRDVVFQDDPFRQLPISGLAVGIEAPRVTIGTESWNANWVRWAYGDAALANIKDRTVACSGVTYGDRDSMLRYLRIITGEIARLSLLASQTSGIDQGIHNHLVWTGRLGDVLHLHTLQSPLATIGMMTEADLRLTADGRLMNADGSVPAIVHQHDRWPRLAEALARSLATRPVTP